MGNCVSKKCAYAGQQCDSVIEIIKEAYQTLFLTKERLYDVVYSTEDQWGEDKLERTLNDIDKFYEKSPWLCELGKGHMIKISEIYVAQI